MAIQGIGGSRAYVITGNISPASKAQYWAGLVSAEKYKLYEAAQQSALAQMKMEQASFETQQKAYNEMRELYNKEIAAIDKQIAAIKKDEAKSRETFQRDLVKAQNDFNKGYKQTIRYGKDGAASSDVQDEYGKTIEDYSKLSSNAARIVAEQRDSKSEYEDKIRRKYELTSDEDYEPLINDDEKRTLENFDTNISNQQANLNIYSQRQTNLTTQLQAGGAEPEEGEAPAQREREPTSITTQAGRKAPVAAEFDPAPYQQRLQELQARREGLATERGALQAPTTPTGSLIERTRQEYAQAFGGQPTAAPTTSPMATQGQATTTPSTPIVEPPMAMSADRRAELEALGADEAFLQQLGIQPEVVEQGAVTGDIEQIRAQAQQRAEAGFQPSPLTQVVAGFQGEQPTPELQSELMTSEPTFEQIAAMRALEMEQQPLPMYDAGRAEAEEARAAVPSPIQEEPLSEQQRRLQAAVSPFGALGASYYPEVTERDLEFQALQMEPPIEQKPKKSTLSPEVAYKYDRIVESKKMLKNPPRFDQNKPDYALLVEKLYNPASPKADELFVNAWAEITKAYTEDKEKMKNAHVYLMYLDRKAEEDKKPK